MRNGRTFHYVNAPFSRKNLTRWRARRRRQPAAWALSCGVARARDAAARLPCGHDGRSKRPGRAPAPLVATRTSRTCAPRVPRRRWGHPPLSVQPPFHPASPSRRRRLAVATPSRRRPQSQPFAGGARDAARRTPPALTPANHPAAAVGSGEREPPPASERARMGCDGERASERRAPPDKTQT